MKLKKTSLKSMYYTSMVNVFRRTLTRRVHLGKVLRGHVNEENLCVVQRETNDLELETRSIIPPQGNEVLVNIKNVCISNNLENNFQLHIMNRNNNVRSRTTIIPGSLATGTVVKTGEEAKTLFQVGDSVVLEPGISCLNCQFCSSGQTHLCTSISYIGTSAKDGALCKFMNHPAYFCHKLDSKVPLDNATLTTKVACAIHCYEKAEINKDSKVLILGSNLLGLITLMVFKHLGIGSVFVAELSNYRLELAKRVGADFVLKLAPYNSPEYPEYINEIMKTVFTQPPDITIDSVGSPYSVETSFHITKSGGKIVLMAAQQSTLAHFLHTTLKEMKVIGCYSYTRKSFLKALNIMKNENLPLNSISSLKVNFNRAIDAFSYHRAMMKETVLTIITNETEKDKIIKDSDGLVTQSRDQSQPAKLLDKDAIQEIQSNIKQSVSQTVSELSSQEKSEEMKNNKDKIILGGIENSENVIAKESTFDKERVEDEEKERLSTKDRQKQAKITSENTHDNKSDFSGVKKELIKDNQPSKPKTITRAKVDKDAKNEGTDKDDK